MKGADDIGPVIQLNDEEGPVLTCFIHDVNRDHALEFIVKAVPAYGATEAYLGTDSHYTRSLTNPTTGEEWGPGGMQQACDNEGACALGLITDTISFMFAEKRGRMQMRNRPYHIHASDQTVAWQDDPEPMMDSDEDGQHMEGLIPDVLRDALSRPDLLEATEDPAVRAAMEQTTAGLEPWEERLHRILGGTHLLAADPRWSILLVLRNETEQDIAEESQQRWAEGGP